MRDYQLTEGPGYMLPTEVYGEERWRRRRRSSGKEAQGKLTDTACSGENW